MIIKKFRIPFILSILIIALAMITSLGGIFMEDLYQDNAYSQSVGLGNDLVTLAVVVPILIGALFFAMKGSYKAQLIWLSSLFYMFYNYMFYLFACAFNNFFLFYVILVSSSIYAIIFTMINMDIKGIKKRFHPGRSLIGTSFFLFFIAGSLMVVNIIQILNFIRAGELPEHVLNYEWRTSVIFAIDLSILLPTMIVSGVLLLKAEAWGFVLSVIMLFKMSTYGLALLAMVFTSISQGIDPLTPFYLLIFTGGTLFLGYLLKSMKTTGGSIAKLLGQNEKKS